jgi:hypothetical protein
MRLPWSHHPPDLDAVAAPTHLDVAAHVVGDDSLVSPFTGMPAAALVVVLTQRRTVGSGDSRGHETTVFDLLGSSILGETLRLRPEGSPVEIDVPVASIRFRHPPEHLGMLLLERALPPSLEPLAHAANGEGPLYFRETTLRAGDRVRLRATVEPSTRFMPSGYREQARRVLVTRPALAPVELEELLDVPAW